MFDRKNHENNEKTKTNKWLGWISLIIVYIVWGSTYLAIRVGIREGSGFTPFMLGAMRTIPAAIILMGYAIIRKNRMRLTSGEFWSLFSSGILLWLGGNGLLIMAERRTDSGMAALIIAITPLWAELLNAALQRVMPSWKVIVALLVGLAGIFILSIPVLQSNVHADIFSIFLLVLASICWAGGTVIQKRWKIDLSPSVRSGYQLLFGGLGFLLTALILGENIPKPIPEAWLAWGYLLVFGSLLAFPAYLEAVRLLPISIVMTYGYVNPIIAVFMGWLVLSEKVSSWTIIGAVFVFIGVASVFQINSKINSVGNGKIPAKFSPVTDGHKQT